MKRTLEINLSGRAPIWKEPIWLPKKKEYHGSYVPTKNVRGKISANTRCTLLSLILIRFQEENYGAILRVYGIGGRLKEALESVYVKGEFKNKMGYENKEWFKVTNGVKQESVLSPICLWHTWT